MPRFWVIHSPSLGTRNYGWFFSDEHKDIAEQLAASWNESHARMQANPSLSNVQWNPPWVGDWTVIEEPRV